MCRTRPFRSLRSRLGAPLLLAALALVSVAPSAWTDDRDLVKQGQKDPYVFVLLDVSGSMNQSISCTQAQINNGECTLLCPDGECLPRMVGDDPASRLVVAKKAIYQIVKETDGLNFGFATFDQREMKIYRKHWWYALRAVQPNGFITLQNGRVYPAPGQEEVFGDATWVCNTVDTIGCQGNNPADLSDAWEFGKIQRWPKLGVDNSGNSFPSDFTRVTYIRDGATYRVTWTPLNRPDAATNRLGNATVTMRLTVDRCTNTNCTSVTGSQTKDLVWEKQDEMIYWEPVNPVDRTLPAQTYFGNNTGVRGLNGVQPLTNWDSNTDAGDAFGGVNIRQDTIPDPAVPNRGAAFTIGDVIPLDWKNNQRQRILERMAPNIIGDPSATPDFQVATYFNDFKTGSDSILRLKDSTKRPLVAEGTTPIGGSMRDFRTWLTSWYSVASDQTLVSGVKRGDPNFDCRPTYLLLITDGLASDGNLSCTEATALRTLSIGGKAYPVKTYVVALGLKSNQVAGFDNNLSCIAYNGGTGKFPDVRDCRSSSLTDSCDDAFGPLGDGKDDGPGPLFPQNETELVAALRSILNSIRGDARSFAAAAVPSVQANIQDKVVLSSFTPVNEVIWPGRIDAYVKPIPTKSVTLTLADGTTEVREVPDRDRLCTTAGQIGCRLWDGGEKLMLQAPTQSEITSGDFNLDTAGGGSDKRRVYFMYTGSAGTLEERRFFKVPTTSADWTDMLVGMKICAPLDLVCQLLAANRNAADAAIRYFHKVKQYDNPNVAGAKIDFLLGDIFHSDPIVVGEPNNFRYYASNLNGYRDYFAKHRLRRKVLLVGSNDGALHAFDAGIFRGTLTTGKFDNGSGHELFAYIPRAVLPALKKASDDANASPPKTDQHTFKVDGGLTVADVYINPLFPATGAREWRTVAVGGLREGGGTFSTGGRSVYSGYYALDITQPDELNGDEIPQPAGSPAYVPSCPNASASCGPQSYPGVLWEFNDPCLLGPCDEEPLLSTGRGTPDLGDTWSVPNIGRIKICTTTTVPCPTANIEDRHVAIFGGGMDPTRNNVTGNWLYMVDIETGKAIYKRQLDGSAPSKPAAVDTDLDGYLDTLYIGTVRGFLYKADISTAQPLNPLADNRVTAAAWNPFKIFDTGGRPMYYPPAVVFITQKGRYALAFGTGDRERLWESTTVTGRFYLILDDGWNTSTSGLPFTAANFQQLTVSSTSVAGADYLINNTNPSLKNGWYLELAPAERVITETFALSGVTVFSSFQPTTTTGTSGSTTVCGYSGNSRIFVLNTTNGNAIFDTGQRFRTVKDFVTSPFTERGQTQNDPNGTGGTGGGNQPEELTEHLRRVMLELQKLFPSSCKFANYTINIKAVRSDTGLEFIAPVPVCMIEKNWKEL